MTKKLNKDVRKEICFYGEVIWKNFTKKYLKINLITKQKYETA